MAMRLLWRGTARAMRGWARGRAHAAAGGVVLGAGLACVSGGCSAQSLLEDLQSVLVRIEVVDAQLKQQAGGTLISVGEALIDFIPGEDGRFQPLCGGAPFNVALTMARLTAPTAFLSNVSSDMFGDTICTELAGAGVDLSLVQRVADPTTLAFVKVEKGCDPQYAFFFRQAADRSLTADTLPPLPSDASALHLSMGAITLETEPVASAFERLFSTCGPLFTSFDPNIRDKMIPNAQKYKQLLISRWLRHFDLVKVSDADLAYLYGVSEDALDMDAIATEWLHAAAPKGKLLLITRGARGTIAYRSGRAATPVVEVALQPVQVIDTVGAGDSYMGAFLFSLRKNGFLRPGALAAMSDDDLETTMRFAARVAAITCTRSGADPPTLDEVGR